MTKVAAFDVDTLLQWPFAPVEREYGIADTVRFARGFGAGLPGAMAAFDARFLDPAHPVALPMIAVPLADGEFWQQNPATGIDWTKIVHAEEVLTLHRPMPTAGTVCIQQKVSAIYDRGADKGAVMVQRLALSDANGALADIDVTTLLRGNGGFGGAPPPANAVPLPLDRAADRQIDLATPHEEEAVFRIAVDLAITRTGRLPGTPGRSMLRGVASFGLAGRAALALAADNEPARLRRLGVRYAGPVFTGETVRVDLWQSQDERVAPALFRMRAVERDVPVLSQGFIEFAK